MRRTRARWPVLSGLAVGLLATAAVAAASPKSDGPGSGDSEAEGPVARLRAAGVHLQLRYRLEHVDQRSFRKEATASTLRTVLGYTTPSRRGWSLHLEAESVDAVGNDDLFDSGRNAVDDRPVVADPAGTELQQVFLGWQGEGGSTVLRLGRQEIALGDQRFVGPVGWRQHHQSFDALRFEHAAAGGWSFGYAFLDEVHRVTRDHRDLSAHLIDVGLDLGGAGELAAYGYLLDYRQARFAGLSTDTFGVELAGGRDLVGGGRLLWELEAARQTDAGDNPDEVDADYRFASLGLALAPLTVKAGWEVLSGSPGEGRFTTSLATLHKFNGWADRFLTTPADGLEDRYLELSGAAGPLSWRAALHDFRAESRSLDYGRELDLLLSWATPVDAVVALKAAFYDARGFSVDTDKVWLYTTWGF